MLKRKMIGMIAFVQVLSILSPVVLGADTSLVIQDFSAILKQQSSVGTGDINIKLDSGKIYTNSGNFECKDRNINILGDNTLIKTSGVIKLNNCSLSMTGVGVSGSANIDGFILSSGKDKISIAKSKITNLKSFIKVQGTIPSISVNQLFSDSTISNFIDISAGRIVLINVSSSIFNGSFVNVGNGTISTINIKESSLKSSNPLFSMQGSGSSKIDKIIFDKSIVKSNNMLSKNANISLKIINSKILNIKDLSLNSVGTIDVSLLNSYMESKGGSLKGTLNIIKGLLISMKLDGVKSIKNSVIRDSNISLLANGQIDSSLIYSFVGGMGISGTGKIINSQIIGYTIASSIINSKNILTEIAGKVVNYKLDGNDKLPLTISYSVDLLTLSKDSKQIDSMKTDPSKLLLKDTNYGILSANLKYIDKSVQPKIDTSIFDKLLKENFSTNLPSITSSQEISSGAVSSVSNILTGNSLTGELVNTDIDQKKIKTVLPAGLISKITNISMQGSDILNATYFGIAGKNYFIIGILLILVLAFIALFNVGKKTKEEKDGLNIEIEDLKKTLKTTEVELAKEEKPIQETIVATVASVAVMANNDSELLSLNIDTQEVKEETPIVVEEEIKEEIVSEDFKLEMSNPMEEEVKEETPIVVEEEIKEEIVSEDFKLEMSNPMEEEVKEETPIVVEEEIKEEIVSEDFKLEMSNPMEEEVKEEAINLDISNQDDLNSTDNPSSLYSINIDDLGVDNIDISSQAIEVEKESSKIKLDVVSDDDVFDGIANNLNIFMGSDEEVKK